MNREIERIQEAYECRDPALRHRYSMFDPAYRHMAQKREAALLEILEEEGYRDLARRRILDLGCGHGRWLRDLVRWGADPEKLWGIDLLEERVAEARRLCPPRVRLAVAEGSTLPLPDGTMDLVLQSTVFTSVLDVALRRRLASEMLRVLAPGGAVIWYDFRVDNPRNPDVRGIGRREIRSLFSGCALRLRSVTLAPPLARRVAPFSRILTRALTALPFLRTHLIGLIHREGEGSGTL